MSTIFVLCDYIIVLSLKKVSTRDPVDFTRVKRDTNETAMEWLVGWLNLWTRENIIIKTE